MNPVGQFERLPTELLYEIHLLSLNPHLPHVSLTLYNVFSRAPSSIKAAYLLSCTADDHWDRVLARAACFPICSVEVVQAIGRVWRRHSDRKGSSEGEGDGRERREEPTGTTHRQLPCTELPLRPFLALAAPSPDPPCTRLHPASSQKSSLALVSHLLTHHAAPPNSHFGGPLIWSVKARHTPTIDLLLSHGADPSYKNGLAVIIAIQARDLELVRKLVARTGWRGGGAAGKRRRVDGSWSAGGRVRVTIAMVQTAMRVGAGEIVDFLQVERGYVLDRNDG